jgi:murein DD-endopeptidase MepM/ murein hydrolase activator NlpD
MDREGRPTKRSMAGGRVNSVMRPLRQVYRRLTPPWTPRLQPVVFHSFDSAPAPGRAGPRMLCAMVWSATLLVIAVPLGGIATPPDVIEVPARVIAAPFGGPGAPARVIVTPSNRTRAPSSGVITTSFRLMTGPLSGSRAPSFRGITRQTPIIDASSHSAGADDARWQWPLRPPPPVVRRFDPPAHPWEAGHRGVDLAASPGRPVFAAGPGRVTFARDLAGRGVVTITHGALRTTYLPVRPTVRPGQIVAAAARIGVVEDVLGHCGPQSCLHWGLLRGDSYLDPLWLLGLGPVRLLPWWHSPVRATAGTDRGRERPAPPTGPVRPADGAPARRPAERPPARRPPDEPPVTAPMARPVSATSAIGAAVGPIAIAGAVALAVSWTRSRRRRRTECSVIATANRPNTSVGVAHTGRSPSNPYGQH